MCRNITVLRGLEPPATHAEVEDAAGQFIRKIAGLSSPAQMQRDDVRRAIDQVSRAALDVLASLPARRATAPGPPSRRLRPGEPGSDK